MKLLTINCHSWQEENQLEKIRQLAATIHEKEYDAIALQEVSQSASAEQVDSILKQDNYAVLLLEELRNLGVTNYQLVWDIAHLAYDDTLEEGIAILTKHPINHQSSFVVTKSEDISFWKTRKIVKVTIDFHGQQVSFFSCHLGWWNDEDEPSRHQINQLVHAIDPGHTAFLMGDFNSEAAKREEGYDYLLEQGLYDTYMLAEEKDDGVTVKGNIAGWSKNKDDKRIDFIFSSKKVDVLTSKVIFNGDNKPVISDHFGLEISLDF